MFTQVTPQEWERAKVILAQQQGAAKKANSSLEDVSLKISRKQDPDNILQHSFHFIQGKLVASDRQWLGKGGSGKAKYAVDENGTIYILRLQSKHRPEYHLTNQRIFNKTGGVYYSYTRSLSTEQDFFKKVLNSKNGKERQTKIKHVELLEAIGDTNVLDFLHNKGSNLSSDQRIILAIQSALALYDFHTVLREIHRDFKEGNMVINTKALEKNPFDFRITLIDWDFSSELPYDANYLVDGSTIGTPGYRSPEVCTGIASPAGDIFALGVSLENILSPLFKAKKISQRTEDLIDETSNNNPIDRPSIPDLVRALWDEVSSTVRDDFGNDAIVQLHKRIRELPPPLTPEEKKNAKIIDTVEKLFTTVAMERWSELDESEQQEIFDKPRGGDWSKQVKLRNVRVLLDSLDKDLQIDILRSCSARVTNYIMKNTEPADLALEEFIKNLEYAIVFFAKEVETARPDHLIAKNFLREVAPLLVLRQASSPPSSLEPLIAALNSNWKIIEKYSEYKIEPNIKIRFQTLSKLWSALPETQRLDKKNSEFFSFMQMISEIISSESLESDTLIQQTAILRADVAINELFSVTLGVAKLADKTDPFVQCVQKLSDNVAAQNKNNRISPIDFIQEFRDILCNSSALYEPEVSAGLLGLVELATGFDDLSDKEPKEIQNLMHEVLDVLETRYREGITLFEGKQPTTRVRLGS